MRFIRAGGRRRQTEPIVCGRGGRFSSIERPAPGYRDSHSGVQVNVGYHGFSYSSSVSGNSGVYLNFSVTDLNPSGTYYRGYGFQLRCLSE
ncbi:hypothetical protein [uncultured Rikenella sp.]|uniref:hypothetical protein n=1 Tax=uncultured Rikenella sp. TaxID=368003 RepID=UPI0025E8D7B1|nr:hypothetical protein [uncultured Rikenella sp.]